MDSIIIAVLMSFFMGVFGYFIFRFWVLPIGRYRKIKNRVAIFLKQYEDDGIKAMKQIKKDGTASRQYGAYASLLNNTYYDDLPQWYKILIKSRGESPEEAAKDMLALSGIRNPAHAMKRMEQIKKYLKLRR